MLRLAALIPDLRDAAPPVRAVTPDEARRPFGLAATATVRVRRGGRVDDVVLDTPLPGRFDSLALARFGRAAADVDAAFASVTADGRGHAAGVVLDDEVRIVDADGRTVLADLPLEPPGAYGLSIDQIRARLAAA